MRKLIDELKYRKIDYSVLEDNGFVLCGNIYKYEEDILDGEFRVVVEVCNDVMTSKLIDVSIDEEYLLVDVENVIGEFVGRIRDEYNLVINNIINKSTISDIFKLEQTKLVIKYVKKKYGDELEFLWEKSPKNAVFRNKKNCKWYGAVLYVSRRKLGMDSDEMVEIIDLSYQKGRVDEVIDNRYIFPGYHMNKDSWITIILDGSFYINKIYELIDNSYEISLSK